MECKAEKLQILLIDHITGIRDGAALERSDGMFFPPSSHGSSAEEKCDASFSR